MKKIYFAIFVLLSSIAFAKNPQYGGTLVFGRAGDSVTLDPSHASDGESFYATVAIYDKLLDFKYGSKELIPSLAKSWEISENALEYTFKLRKGIYFHKTKFFNQESEFTSKDVVFSFKRQFDKTHPYNKIGGAFKYWAGMNMKDIVKDVVAINKYEVKFVLKKKEAPFLANLAMGFTGILSEDYANYLLKKNKQNDLAKKPIGTGPFVFKEWIKDDKIVLTANKEYWNNRPYVDKLILKVIPSNSVRAAELKANSIHIMDFPNPSDIKELEKNSNIKLIKQEGLNIGYLAFNTQRKPFDNKFVRQAISYAINTQGIIDSIYEGLGKVATNPIPPTIWGYNKNLKGYNYNIKKAKLLLEKAGYKNGFETNIYSIPVPRPYNPNGKKVAIAIQDNLAQIGIKAKIISYDWSTYLKKTSNGEHDMVLYGWTGDNGDPDNFLNVLLSKKSASKKPSQNRAFWQNDEFSDLVEKAKIITDIKERTKLYEKAQEIFEKEAPWKPIAHSIVVVPVVKKVHGFKIDPIGSRRFKDVWIEK